jgi:hypothetical protein
MTTSLTRNHFEKENISNNRNITANTTNHSSYKIHTPPRLRSINISKNTASKKNTLPLATLTNVTMIMNHDDEAEDFSFAKLKGAIQSFEQRQKAHFINSCPPQQLQQQHYNKFELKTNLSNSSYATQSTSCATVNSKITSCSSFGSVDSNGTSTSVVTRDDVNCARSVGQLSSQPTEIDNNHNDEDFSFQKLKEKAIGLEKNVVHNTRIGANSKLCSNSITFNINNNVKCSSNEDFSFETLRQKALTPIKNKTIKTQHHRVAPHTNCGQTRHLVPPKTPIAPLSVSHLRPKSTTKQIQTPSTKQEAMDRQQPLRETVNNCKNTAFNPNRFQFKPKIRKEEVQATNDAMASVQKLSQWLSDDPFEKKKQLLIRKGEQIACKSKAFEHEELLNGMLKTNKESRAKREKHYFPEGKVSQNKDWLQNHAFGDKKKLGNGENDHVCGVMEKKKMIEAALKSKSNRR